jgi:hypothetical protein
VFTLHVPLALSDQESLLVPLMFLLHYMAVVSSTDTRSLYRTLKWRLAKKIRGSWLRS